MFAETRFNKIVDKSLTKSTPSDPEQERVNKQKNKIEDLYRCVLYYTDGSIHVQSYERCFL